MKKQGSMFLLMCALFFSGLSIGFFVGRNYTQNPVQVSVLAQDTFSTSETTVETTVPQSEETQESTQPVQTEETQAQSEGQDDGLINVNTADQQMLMELPGIGETLSQRIIDYREAHGPFKSLSELMNVSGIGEKRLENILPYATVGG